MRGGFFAMPSKPVYSKRNRKKMDLYRREGGEELRAVKRGKTVNIV